MTIELFISILSLAGVTIIGFLDWRTKSKASEADAALDWSQAAESLEKRMEELKTKMHNLEKRMSITMVYIVELVESHIRHGIKPPPPPDELKSDPAIIRLFAAYDKNKKKRPARYERRKL
jgi:hypothetical protein